ncbi:MAG: hypothetical protein J0L58_09940 [Burkholderiales bacterium]|uniref:hypothetical protein n=1 Tax=Inhella sp. TaxID=1921806 RepID=UPI001AD290B3|nr:hypothetical protein [Burkholderiales bacterium]
MITYSLQGPLGTQGQDLQFRVSPLESKYAVRQFVGLPTGVSEMHLTASGLVKAPKLHGVALDSPGAVGYRSKLRVEGDAVVMDLLAEPGGPVIYSWTVESLASTPLTGTLASWANAVPAVGLSPWAERPTPLYVNPTASFLEGAAYRKLMLKNRGDRLTLTHCGTLLQSGGNIAQPCGRAASLQAAFPLSLTLAFGADDGAIVTWNLADGRIESIKGRQVWTTKYWLFEYAIYWEDGVVYLGKVIRDGADAAPPIYLLNQAAIDSIKAGLR